MVAATGGVVGGATARFLIVCVAQVELKPQFEAVRSYFETPQKAHSQQSIHTNFTGQWLVLNKQADVGVN